MTINVEIVYLPTHMITNLISIKNFISSMSHVLRTFQKKSFEFLKEPYKILSLFPGVAGFEMIKEEDNTKEGKLRKNVYEQVPVIVSFYMTGLIVSHLTLRVLIEIVEKI